MTDFNREGTDPVAQDTGSIPQDTVSASQSADSIPQDTVSASQSADPVVQEADDSVVESADPVLRDTPFTQMQQQPQSQQQPQPPLQLQLQQQSTQTQPQQQSPQSQSQPQQQQPSQSQPQPQQQQPSQSQPQPQQQPGQSYYQPQSHYRVQPQQSQQPQQQQSQPNPQFNQQYTPPQAQQQSPQQTSYQPQARQYPQPGFSAQPQQGGAPYGASTQQYQRGTPYSASTQPQPAPQSTQQQSAPQQPTQQQYPPQYAAASSAQNYRPVSTAPSRAPKQQRGSSKVLAFVMGFVGVLVGAALTFGVLFFTTSGFNPSNSTNPNVIATSSNGDVTITPRGEDVSLAEVVAAKALPSVVNIDVYASFGGGFYDDYGLGSGDGSELEEYGLGSGVVISEDGYILTNHHVVEGGTEFLVRFDQDNQFKATVVGEDPTSDLAILKVDATGLTPIEIGDSSDVVVGEWVMALGSPFGLEKSVSTGIVSALFRSTTMESTTGVNFYANMIQTDAAINPGNSGGALVNAEGKLIGINTLISSDSGSSAGVGFAIPSNYAMNVAQQIMDGKEVEHAFLGVQLRTVDPGNASSFNSSVDAGAYIGEVVAGSPAAEAGLREGDIITKMDDTPISSAAELVINVRGHLVGDTVTLEVQREGGTETIRVTLGSDKS